MANKIGVLGGRGYIGSYLSQHLKGDVVAVTRTDVDLLDAAKTLGYLKKQQFDVVVGAAKHAEYPLADRTDIASTNLAMFTNVLAGREYIGRYINLGSGAEFDRRYNILMAKEEWIERKFPLDGYGLSRNTISRICLATPNFYTVRLFGVLHGSEQESKLFRKMRINPRQITVKDCMFDYMTLPDVATIVQHYIDEPKPAFDDINAVYDMHLSLPSMLRIFSAYHRLTTDIHIDGKTNHYTGDGYRLSSLNLPLRGLFEGMKEYQ